MTASGNFSSIDLIQVADLATVQESGKLRLDLPGLGCTSLHFKAKNVVYNSSSDYTWYGEVLESESDTTCNCREGFLSLVAKDGRKFGNLVLDSDRYAIFDAGENVRFLAKADLSNFPETVCPLGQPEQEENDSLLTSTDRSGGGFCPVRILFVYTTVGMFNGRDAVEGETQQTAALAMHQMNQALSNSDINACDLMFEMAGIEELVDPFESEFTEIKLAVADISTNGANYHSADGRNLNELRTDHQADIVAIMAFNSLLWTDGAQDIAASTDPDPNAALAIINPVSVQLNSLTFEHEISHLFGCRHQTCDAPCEPFTNQNCDDTGTSFAHARIFKAKPKCEGSKLRSTIVRSTTFHPNPIPYFSNPDVFYLTKRTGVENEADNAQKLRSTACTVSDFQQTFYPLLIHIEGVPAEPSEDWFFGCPCILKTLKADVYGGGSSHTFIWHKSIDGINWGSPISSSETAQFHVPCDEPFIFIRLKVISGGQEATTIQVVKAVETLPSGSSCPVPLIGNGPGLTATNAVGYKLTVSPNPASGVVNIQFFTPETDNFDVSISDWTGRVVYRKNAQTLEKGAHQLDAGQIQFRNGYYFVQIAGASKSIVSKFSSRNKKCLHWRSLKKVGASPMQTFSCLLFSKLLL